MPISHASDAALRVRWLPGDRSTVLHATRVRSRLPARLLRSAGVDARLVRRREDAGSGDTDVLVVQDPRSIDQVAALRRARSRGVTVVVDLSDATLARSDIARAAIDSASAVTVRHASIAAVVEHDVIATVDDAVEWAHPSPVVPLRPRPGQPARLVWFGRGNGIGPGTGVEELTVIRSALCALDERRRTELLLVTEDRSGAQRFLTDNRLSGRWVDWSPWRLRSVLAASHVCLLPVADQEIGRLRSVNRAATAVLHGVPPVAGAVPSYEALAGAVSFGSWEPNIERLLADQHGVEQLVGQGRDAVRGRFSDDAVTRRWRQVIRDAVDQTPMEAAPSPLSA